MKLALIVISVMLIFSACSLLPKQPVPVAVEQAELPKPPVDLIAPTEAPNSIQEWQALKLKWFGNSSNLEMKPLPETPLAKPTSSK